MSHVINVETLSELAEIMGDDMSLLLETYIEDCTGKVALFCSMSLVTEQEEIFKIAHSLKGSSRNIGVTEFADYCEEAERLAKTGSLTESDFNPATIQLLFDRAVNALNSDYL